MDFESWLRSTFNACYFNWYQCQYIRLFSSFHFRSRFVRCFRQKKTKNTIFEMNSSVVFRVWYLKKNQTKNTESTNCIQWKALQGWFVSTVCNFVSGEKESQKKQKERQKKTLLIQNREIYALVMCVRIDMKRGIIIIIHR